MKLLVLVSVLLVCFFVEAAGLKCYECTNLESFDGCQAEVTDCGPDMSQKYCVTVDFEQAGERRTNICGRNCVWKTCVNKVEPERCVSGAFNNSLVSWDDPVKGMVYCCEGDLCNNSNKMCKKSIIPYAVVLINILNFL